MPAPPNVIHFAGTDALTTCAHTSNLVQIAGIPTVSRRFSESLQALSQNATNWIGLPAPAKSDASRLRSVLSELSRHGFTVYWNAAEGTNTTSWMVTSQLPADGAESVKRNLAAWLSGDQPAIIRSFPPGNVDGWVASLPSQKLVLVVRDGTTALISGAWSASSEALLTGADATSWKLPVGKLELPSVNGQPAWLHSRIDARSVSALAAAARGVLDLWIGTATVQGDLQDGTKMAGVKGMEFAVASVDQFVRTRVSLEFDEPRPPGRSIWQVPTNSIRDPLISFTALQPAMSPFQQVLPWLGPQDFVALLGLEKVTGPMFAWGLGDVPFQFYAAVPFQDAAGRMAGLAQGLETRWGDKVKQRSMGQIVRDEKTGQVSWVGGLPMAVPFLAPAADKDFIVAGIFPMAPGTNSMPRELLDQVQGRTNLLYYNWEITQGRLVQWKLLGQLISMMQPSAVGRSGPPGLPLPVSNAARGGGAWLNDLGSQLGNSVTELTATAPDTWTLTRKSHSGLTALEWVLLDNWLSSADFPALQLKNRQPVSSLPAPPAPPQVPQPPAPPKP